MSTLTFSHWQCCDLLETVVVLVTCESMDSQSHTRNYLYSCLCVMVCHPCTQLIWNYRSLPLHIKIEDHGWQKHIRCQNVEPFQPDESTALQIQPSEQRLEQVRGTLTNPVSMFVNFLNISFSYFMYFISWIGCFCLFVCFSPPHVRFIHKWNHTLSADHSGCN